MTPSERARKLLAEATAAPWEAAPDGSLVTVAGVEFDIAEVFPTFGEPYADGSQPANHEQKRKNAALIAAAPELLAALADEVERLREALKAQERSCWHCGDVLETMPDRCDRCPDECDVPGCDAPGCESQANPAALSTGAKP